MSERGCLIEHLILEHVQIVKDLNRLKDIICCSEIDLFRLKSVGLEALRSLRVSLELHHRKEEKLLFPVLYQRAPLNQGGPQCGLFMTHLLIENTGRSFMEKASQLGLKIEPPRREVQEIVAMNSPLTIPLHEHWGGHIALEILEEYLRDLESNPSQIQKDLFIEGMRFDRMMRLHIEKEETCLFVLADMFIPSSLQSELLALAFAER